MLMIDIDFFKTVNDTFGHVAGDAVLTAVASTIVSCTRDSDVVFRYGGEEFVVILTNTQAAGAKLLAERIRASIEARTIPANGNNARVTVSIGVAELGIAESKVDLIERADEMLYCAKERGRNQVAMAEGQLSGASA